MYQKSDTTNNTRAHKTRHDGGVQRVGRYLLVTPIIIYQKVLSPYMPSSCRFQPTCSQYAKEAIEKYGFKGVWMGIKRILRCHPFRPGGYDPVP
ncbi:MAG: membrane protein insertion efficiency factor YidD [Chlorobi bacterium]|nr:membrane protein insertion efficiency factor YidD [Chlorobiota bacterium]